MPKKVFHVFIFLFLFSVVPSLVNADNQTLFGPRIFEIGRWHVLLSVHSFNVEDSGEGVITITKNTPEEQIRGGFIFFNTTLVPLREFLVGDELVFEKEFTLQSINFITVFLRGTPGASVTIEVNKAGGVVPLPEVTFSADPQSITLGESSTLAWTTTHAHSVSIDPGIGSVEPNGSFQVSPAQNTIYTLTAVGTGGATTQSLTVTVDIPAPFVSISADPETILLGESSTLTWSSINADTCEIDQGVGSVNVNGSMSVSPTETTTYIISATGLGGTATDSIVITVNDTSPPTVSISADPTNITPGQSSTLTWTSTNAQSAHIDNSIGVVSVNGSTAVYPDHTTTYNITVTGLTGSASAQVVVMVTGNPELQPEGSFGEQYEDLIPPDATVDEYDPKRFSLITGLVHALDSSPISDVSITIHGHREYGTVSTDAQGRFSIPVEGGSTITLVYHKVGLITAQRKVYVPWNDIAIAETIQMIMEDPVSTTITFDGSLETVVTHQSTAITDEFGTRSCSMVFTGDNQAYLLDEQGNDIHELTTITTRATEFATPESMPAKLPPNSAYTYCSELSVDGAQRVRFEKPVITWIDNFLGFDVGEIVPVGYYDRDRGVWVPSDNGMVVKLLDTDANGIVDALDADGDDQPDDLNEDGSFSDEVLGLDNAQKYPPDSTFWRVKVTHFTPWDCNWPYGPPADTIPPNPEGEPNAEQQKPYQQPCETGTGSSVEDRDRIFHEDIPIPGTDITLHYVSNRVEGYKAVISVPASGEIVPESLKNIIVKINVAGQTLEQTLDPLPNHKAEFVWDGLDQLGRLMIVPTTAHVSVGFVYDLVYYSASEAFIQSFAQAGDDTTLIRGRNDIITWKHSDIAVSSPTVKGKGIIAEGWTISLHHHLSLTVPNILHKGDGTISKKFASLIDTVAGSGTYGYSGDGGPATEAQIYYPYSVAVDASGNLYITDGGPRIRKVDTSGIITTVVGNGTYGCSGDGGPATEAQLDFPWGITVDSSDNLYIADIGCNCIRKVDTGGIITTVAGNGNWGYGGDGGPATQAELDTPMDVTVDASGNFYIVDGFNNCIRKVDTNGIITTVAGNGTFGYSGDQGPATQAELGEPGSVAVDTSGNLYIADTYNYRIRKVDTSGIITTVAGNGAWEHSGDGGPATEAQFGHSYGVAVDAPGNLYIADYFNTRIRKVDTSGIMNTVAGNGTRGYSGDEGPATQAEIYLPMDIAIDASGNLHIADHNNRRIRKVGHSNILANSMSTGGIPLAQENGLGHIMSSTGRHKRTVDNDTGVTLREFGYDDDNNLISITDQFENQTTIQRDANSVPTSITSPDGLTTQLTIDTDNHLTRITYPGSSSYYAFEYTSDGLMTAKVEPEENRFEHFFDSNGKLTDATDQEGGHWQFSRTASANGDILAEVLTGEGNLNSYLDHTYSTGEYTSTITGPTGAETLFTRSNNGLTVNKSLSCGMELEFKYGLDPEYKFKFVKEMTESTPSVLKKVTLRDKTYQDTDSDDIPDLITETVTINDKTTTLENDVLQSQKTITSPESRTVTTLYDPVTLVTESVSVSGLFDTVYEYDTSGRLTSVDTNTRGIDLSYNAQGFVETITDAENYTTSYSYDPVGRVIGINRPDTTSIGFTYDDNGNMTVLTNPSTINHGFGFNKVNLNSFYQTPISGSYSYVYDKDRRLKQMNFPSGNQINNVYANGRLEQIQTPEGNIDFTYLCGTKVDSITKEAESITYGYDGKLVTSEGLSGTLTQSLSYGYNNDFNLTSFTYAGDATSYSYDNDDLLTGAGGFAISRNAGNGLPESVTGGALNLSRGFNGYGEVEGQDFNVNSQGLTSWNLIQDNNGRITQKTETVAGATSDYVYTYDSMGRLLTVTKDSTLVEEYQYDPNGTRNYEMNTLRGISGRSFAYSDEDHLLTAGTTTYQYNLDGFLTTKTAGADVTTYDYSSSGDPLGVSLPDGRYIEYVHDPLGRRIAKKVDGVTVEKYLWRGLTRLLAVYDGSDSLVQRFEYADGRMPVAMTSGGSTYYLTYDQVGSLRVVADASGNVVKKVGYDSFGNIIDDTNPSFMVPFGFAGGLHDRDTGLVRFGYRDYDPDTGRWTAKDPILFAGGDTDIYGYVINNPINFSDPYGLIAEADPFNPAPNIPTSNFTKGQKGALFKTGLGAGLIIGGSLTLPEGAPFIAVGIPMLAEGLTLDVIEFGFHGDTSNMPSTWDVFGTVAEQIYNLNNSCP